MLAAQSLTALASAKAAATTSAATTSAAAASAAAASLAGVILCGRVGALPCRLCGPSATDRQQVLFLGRIRGRAHEHASKVFAERRILGRGAQFRAHESRSVVVRK